MVKKHGATTVLIIEDEADILHFISRVLELEGYRVLKASDGNTGMKIIKENPVTLVLLDLRLPGPDGWSILRGIKRNPEFSKIPVVVLTAIAESTQRKKTLRMGAARYLIKPLSAHSLSQTITDILQKKENSYTAAEETAISG
ncbi:MAG TPA: response regulator [Dehalococcoidales bacterium]|nr:response regulator [Dehalococcoidales bacterium]